MQQTILVVDDDISIRELLLYNLKNAGYLVLTAADGVSALLAADEKVDLVLLDLMIPGLDGFDVCRKLKSQNHTARIPVIMLTAK